MAHKTVNIDAGTWVQLTESDVTAIRVQASDRAVLLQATANDTAPISAGGAVELGAGGILLPDVRLTDLFPGVASPARLWALVYEYNTSVSVSHV